MLYHLSDSDIQLLLELLLQCPVLETKDKPRISYSEIRGYSKVYPWAKFWRFSNAFYSPDNYSRDNSAVFVNKHLIGQHGHMTWRRLVIIWHNFVMNIHVFGAYYCGYQMVYKTLEF